MVTAKSNLTFKRVIRTLGGNRGIETHKIKKNRIPAEVRAVKDTEIFVAHNFREY